MLGPRSLTSEQLSHIEQRKCGSFGGIRPAGMSLKIAVPEISALSVRMLEIVEPLIDDIRLRTDSTIKIEGFDPGSERTLAAWLRHASRTDWSIY